LSKSKNFYERSTQVVGASFQSLATTLWKKLPIGFRENLACSTPFYIELKSTTHRLIDRKQIGEAGVGNFLLHRVVADEVYFSYDIPIPKKVVVDCILLTPDNYEKWKIARIHLSYTEIKDVVNAGLPFTD